MERQRESVLDGSQPDRAKQAAAGTVHLARRSALYGLMLAVLVSAAGFLLTSRQFYAIGFPLDDAWIHQTYARNLALLGEWSFIPGKISAGSTAPLWSGLLSIGYRVNLQPYIWTYGLGCASLFGLAFFGELLARSYRPEIRSQLPWIGLFLLGEWHMVWAAVSGMETLLAGLLILLVLWRAGMAREYGWLGVGLLIGLSIWVRPDGLTLLGPAGLMVLVGKSSWKARFREAAWLLAGFAFFFGPYLLFNLVVQGSPWPNTFYAKQSEYAVLRQAPLLLRFANELKLPLLGSGLFLLPGFITYLWQAVRTKRWAILAAATWFVGYALLYAIRLPVTYQYGRYFMPAMPVFFVLGLAGLGELYAHCNATRLGRILAKVWILSTVGIWLGFYGIGAGRYAQDVAIIETEMVSAAKWVASHTKPDALVAAHDIGALGYFAGRDIVDLAGLISPEIIPFIRDEEQIARWLDEEEVDYLVVFKDWYEWLPEKKAPVFQTDGPFSPQQGGSNVWIYSW